MQHPQAAAHLVQVQIRAPRHGLLQRADLLLRLRDVVRYPAAAICMHGSDLQRQLKPLEQVYQMFIRCSLSCTTVVLACLRVWDANLGAAAAQLAHTTITQIMRAAAADAHLDSFVYHHCLNSSSAFAWSFTTYCLLASIIFAYLCVTSFSALSASGFTVFWVWESILDSLWRATPSDPAMAAPAQGTTNLGPEPE